MLLHAVTIVLFAVTAAPSAFAQQRIHPGSTISLDGDLGCVSFEVMQSLLAIAQRTNASASNEDLRGAADKEVRAHQCFRVSDAGFKVLEVRAGLARVRFGQNALWVITDPKLKASLGPVVRHVKPTNPFGIDPAVETEKLERGDLTILGQIKLKSGGDLKQFLMSNRRRLKVANHLSSVYCLEHQIGNAGDGCTVEINVHSVGVRNVDLCSMLVRWRSPLGQTTFMPESGAAKFIDRDPHQFWGALDWNDSRCE
jgi:hypothetical protein